MEEEREGEEMKWPEECEESLSVAAEKSIWKQASLGSHSQRQASRRMLGIPKPPGARTTLVFICLEHGGEPGPINAGWMNEWCDD